MFILYWLIWAIVGLVVFFYLEMKFVGKLPNERQKRIGRFLLVLSPLICGPLGALFIFGIMVYDAIKWSKY